MDSTSPLAGGLMTTTYETDNPALQSLFLGNDTVESALQKLQDVNDKGAK